MAGRRCSTAARILCLGAVLLLVGQLAAAGQAGRSPVKVFILAGQSNMEGQAVADLDGQDYNEGKGTLTMLMEDPDDRKIEEEIRTKFAAAMPGGGYLYHSDHSVPKDVSFQKYTFVMECVRKYGRY